jgi:hypothetical protein
MLCLGLRSRNAFFELRISSEERKRTEPSPPPPGRTPPAVERRIDIEIRRQFDRMCDFVDQYSQARSPDQHEAGEQLPTRGVRQAETGGDPKGGQT